MAMTLRRIAMLLILMVLAAPIAKAQPAGRATLLVPDRVFDGSAMHSGWQVLVQGGRIVAAGPEVAAPADAERLVLPGMTLMPGLIDLHVHLFLHPYDETSWNDQVLKEPLALRTARAVAAARVTLMAGFTTVRDLGTEGAGDADAGLRAAIAQGIVPGPRLLIANRALVASGSYGPKGYANEVPQGAEEADGFDLPAAVRRQIGRGADWVKLYADYRWGPGEPSRPTFTVEELTLAVRVAHDAGRKVAAHASTPEGMRRAAEAGVDTVEHGSEGTPEVFRLMKARGVALCPTLAAGEAVARYAGWNGAAPEPARVVGERRSFAAALAAGVTLCIGGDAGVFAHGDNAREIELMVDRGMPPLDALRAATAGNAKLLGLDGEIGAIAAGMTADLVAVEGDPARDPSALRRVRLVMQRGEPVRAP